jgi:pimeloyl-ACP methyl ester carboxylesterase
VLITAGLGLASISLADSESRDCVIDRCAPRRAGNHRAVVGGYDVGSFVAQTLAAQRPYLVKALVVSPPLPGGGTRVLELNAVREFWYTSFHQLDLARDIVDGHPDAVRA